MKGEFALGKPHLLVMVPRPFEKRDHELVAVGPPLGEWAGQFGHHLVPPLFEIPFPLLLAFPMRVVASARQPKALRDIRAFPLQLLRHAKQ